MRKIVVLALCAVVLPAAAQNAQQTEHTPIEQMLAHCKKFRAQDEKTRETMKELCSWVIQNKVVLEKVALNHPERLGKYVRALTGE